MQSAIEGANRPPARTGGDPAGGVAAEISGSAVLEGSLPRADVQHEALSIPGFSREQIVSSDTKQRILHQVLGIQTARALGEARIERLSGPGEQGTLGEFLDFLARTDNGLSPETIRQGAAAVLCNVDTFARALKAIGLGMTREYFTQALGDALTDLATSLYGSSSIVAKRPWYSSKLHIFKKDHTGKKVLAVLGPENRTSQGGRLEKYVTLKFPDVYFLAQSAETIAALKRLVPEEGWTLRWEP